VTHDQIEAMTMADQIVVMKDGVVEQRGQPLELYDHPANIFVAGFIGSPAMNFLPGRVLGEGAGAMVEIGSDVSLPPARGGREGRAVGDLRQRGPEHLDLAADGEGISRRGRGRGAHRGGSPGCSASSRPSR
jgi:multiple sugar transport system ATP-binding protein